jgi:polyisoprenoid-binding protein YceI
MDETQRSSLAPPPGSYRIEPSESRIEFENGHMFGLGEAKGTVGIRSGEILVADPLDDSSVRVAMPTGPLKTGKSVRDALVAYSRPTPPAFWTGTSTESAPCQG